MISKIKLQHITTMSKWFLVPEMSISVYINNILDFHLSYIFSGICHGQFLL